MFKGKCRLCKQFRKRTADCRSRESMMSHDGKMARAQVPTKLVTRTATQRGGAKPKQASARPERSTGPSAGTISQTRAVIRSQIHADGTIMRHVGAQGKKDVNENINEVVICR